MKQDIFSGLTVNAILKVKRKGLTYYAAELLDVHLAILRPDLSENPERCFEKSSIFFRTDDGTYCVLFNNSNEKYPQKWAIINSKQGVEGVTIFSLDNSDMRYMHIVKNECFFIDDQKTAPVREIVLMTRIIVDAEDLDILQESEFVKSCIKK